MSTSDQENRRVGVDERPVWGAPDDRQTTWSARTTVAAVGIAVALAAVGGVAVYAATGGSAGHPAAGGPPGWGGPGGPGGVGRTVHGETVVSDGEGGFSTELTQTGDVTAASATSVTVRSADGYSQTYVLDADTRRPPQPLEAGVQVSVRATERGGVATATTVMPAR
ncbi:hypothetical protein [Mycobacterium sp. shizuoka-1]|uniref:hypothetical protein n=1 Tax=Mycobacterium sp. shizuoka-1 TaxID=2039281 RepID=UPI000C0666C3|nr:hypothetical protein [Mycobacterium sp. shizuoka-1]GAY14039.1 hypothetical protein MSZK_07650 [Mycobacterium sp. shizuoka-1]